MRLSKLAIPTALVAALAFPTASNAALITPGSAARSQWGDMTRTAFKLKTVRGACSSSTLKSRFHSSVKRNYGRMAKGGGATDSCVAGTTPGGDLIVAPDPTSPGQLIVVVDPDIFDSFDDGGGNPPGSTTPEETGTPPQDPQGPPPSESEEIADVFMDEEPVVLELPAQDPPDQESEPQFPPGGIPDTDQLPPESAEVEEDPPVLRLAGLDPQATNVPEPASLALLGLGLVAIGHRRRKRYAPPPP